MLPLSKNEGKYRNTQETELWNKGDSLFSQTGKGMVEPVEMGTRELAGWRTTDTSLAAVF